MSACALWRHWPASRAPARRRALPDFSVAGPMPWCIYGMLRTATATRHRRLWPSMDPEPASVLQRYIRDGCEKLSRVTPLCYDRRPFRPPRTTHGTAELPRTPSRRSHVRRASARIAAGAPPRFACVPPRRDRSADLKNPALYINRELSWLEFNERVLAQARDAAHPLLERVKFLAIAATNLDEFFMIRVSTTLKKLREGIEDVAPDGYNTEQQLEAMRAARAAHAAGPGGGAGTSCGSCSTAERISFLETDRVDARDPRVPGRLLLARDLSGADAAGVRPGPSVSAHLEPEQELRGRRAARRPDEVRAREGAATCCRGSSRFRDALAGTAGHDVRLPRGRHPREHAGALPRHAGQGRAPVPRRPRRRPRDRAGRSRRPARDRRPQPASSCATARCRCCRSKPTCRRGSSTSSSRTSRSTDDVVVRTARSHGVRRLDAADAHPPPGAEGRAVLAAQPSGGPTRIRK